MTNAEEAMLPNAEFEAIQSELLLNLIAVVKIQQLNIALLWEAIGSGKASVPVAAKMRESSLRLDDCIERVYGLITDNAKSVN